MSFLQIQVGFLEYVLNDAADRLQILNRGRTGPLDKLESDAEKLENDVSFIRGILLRTLEELKHKGTANILKNLFKTIASNDNYDKQILQMNDRLMRRFYHLELDVSQKTEEFEKMENSLKSRREDLEHEYESFLRAGRNNQNILIRAKAVERAEKIEHKQEIAESILADIKRNEDHITTDIILNELFIDDYMETQLVQLEEQIEHWSTKYETDLEVNTTKVKDTKEEIQNLTTENAQMVALIAKRAKEMEKFLEIKAKREAEEAAEKKINNSATAIQAWWRGVMVRHKLGPYSKKKKKKARKPVAKVQKK